MRFSHTDKKDSKIVRHSTYALEFPDKLAEAPDTYGVFILLNDQSDVMYVGHNNGKDLKQAIEEVAGTPASQDSISYRWFITQSQDEAISLSNAWIEKYQPNNQGL